jgi:hypothetical protein
MPQKNQDSVKKPRDLIIKQATQYLEQNAILSMATASLDGVPRVDALEYASSGLDVFVLSPSKSWKVTNIENNPRVFYEIHHLLEIDVQKLKGIIGLQVESIPNIINYNDPKFMEYFEKMEEKFPVFKNMRGLENRVILLFKPTKLWLLDYSKKFFHRDLVIFND